MLPPENLRSRYEAALPSEHLLALEILFALRASAQGVDNALSEWLGSDALTPGRWQVLVVLWAADGPLPQGDIVKALKVSRPTVSDLVDVLVREGHVSVASGPKDRRQVLVVLTDAGRQMTSRLLKENAARLRQTFAALSDTDLRHLLTLLSLLLPLSQKRFA
jgi:DNA-binding MarR family transcriptional regulator